jgi:paraquat-inducible protein B
MSKKASPTLVGLFVVIGTIIAIGTVLVIGSGKLFATKMPYILYFNESVNGLQKGAPVKFKGVTIGKVKTILLHFHEDKKQIHIPVIIELDINTIMQNLDVDLHEGKSGVVQDLVNHVVGRLETDSFVTSRLYIGLRYDPASDALRQVRQNLTHPEIPTEPSTVARITDQLSSIDLSSLSERVSSILAKVDDGLSELDMKEINAQLVATLASIRKIIESEEIVNSIKSFEQTMVGVEQSVTNFNRTLASIGRTSDEIRVLTTTATGEIKPLMAGVNATTAEAVKTLKRVEATAEELRRLVHAQSPMYSRLVKTLDEFQRLARSVRELTDLLRRDPRALISGKVKP